MSWLVTLMIFLSIGGSLCDHDEDHPAECFRREMMEQCERPFPDDFPETADQLEKACRNLQTFLGCLRDAKVKCEDETELDIIRERFNYLKCLCNEDNLYYSVISENIECIARNARVFDGSCSEIVSEENRVKIREYLAPYKEENSTHVTPAMKCLSAQLDVSCYSVTLGHHCGLDVKNAIEPILMSMYSHPVVCGDMKEDLEKLKEDYEAILVAELEIEKKLNRRK